MKEEAGFVRIDEAAAQSIGACATAYEEATMEMLRRAMGNSPSFAQVTGQPFVDTAYRNGAYSHGVNDTSS